MTRFRVVNVVGARPQFVKAAVLSRALRARPDVQEILVHTGQHYDFEMSRVFFEELSIPPPDVALQIGSDTHGRQTGRMLEALDQLLERERPDCVLVVGDTNSTLAGALAAAKMKIPVAHVEAGLRSFDRGMPEEINRVLTDHVSQWLFCPTAAAVANLEREGIGGSNVQVVGDVMYDAVLHFAALADQKRGVLKRIGVDGRPFVLVTLHRAENTESAETLRQVLEGLREVSRDLAVVFPVHPRTRRLVSDVLPSVDLGSSVHLVPPVSYLEMLCLEGGAAVVATDSGGVQKEAFFRGVPCVTLRTTTEWTELVDLGWNRLVPPSSSAAVRDAILGAVGKRGRHGLPYGAGDAAERIVECLTGKA